MIVIISLITISVDRACLIISYVSLSLVMMVHCLEQLSQTMNKLMIDDHETAL